MLSPVVRSDETRGRGGRNDTAVNKARLEHNVAVVTDSGSGIGRASCICFAEERAAVGVLIRSDESSSITGANIPVDGDVATLQT